MQFTYNLQVNHPGNGVVDWKPSFGIMSQTEGDAGTTFIYRFVLSNGTLSVYLPMKITMSRGQSVYRHIAQACPGYEEHKICSHIALHVSQAYYGVDFAPSRATSVEEDFTTNRSSIIRYLAHRYNYRRYLEIGCEYEKNFGLFKNGTFDVAVGVDPFLGGTLRMDSNEFFAQNTATFDLIFIDGLHEAHQLYLDVENALRVLSDGGTIVLHDCHPSHRGYAEFPRSEVDADYYWNGDSYRAAVALRLRSDLEIVVIDVDHGLGVVRRRVNSRPLSPHWQAALQGAGSSQHPVDGVSWDLFAANKDAIMGLVTVAQFRAWLDEEHSAPRTSH